MNIYYIYEMLLGVKFNNEYIKSMECDWCEIF